MFCFRCSIREAPYHIISYLSVPTENSCESLAFAYAEVQARELAGDISRKGGANSTSVLMRLQPANQECKTMHMLKFDGALASFRHGVMQHHRWPSVCVPAKTFPRVYLFMAFIWHKTLTCANSIRVTHIFLQSFGHQQMTRNRGGEAFEKCLCYVYLRIVYLWAINASVEEL